MKSYCILFFVMFFSIHLFAQDEIVITSNDLMINMGKEVFVDGKKVGRAPCEIKIPFNKLVLIEDGMPGVGTRRKIDIFITKDENTKNTWNLDELSKKFTSYTTQTGTGSSKELYSAIEESRKKATEDFYNNNPDKRSFSFRYDGKTPIDSVELVKSGIPSSKIPEIKWKVNQNPKNAFEMSSKSPAMIDFLAAYIYKPKKKFEVILIGGLLKK